MAKVFDTLAKRKKLKSRKPPYWERIRIGQFLGYRRNQKFEGSTWLVRIGKQWTTLGHEADMGYETALDKALEWLQLRGEIEVEDINFTLEMAIDDYQRELAVDKGEEKALVSTRRLKNKLSDKLLALPVRDLKKAQIVRWRDRLVNTEDPNKTRASKDTANRILTILKAALNKAYENQRVPSDRAWKTVKPFEKVGKARTLFLTEKQVSQLLDKAEGALYKLCRAGVLTGARYGELAQLRVSDFDQKQGTLHITEGKTGERTCFLSDVAVRFFKAQTKSKTPNALLLPMDNSEPWGRDSQTRPIKALVQAAKLPRETVFYSLRPYHISKALLAGVQIQVVAENCGTSVRMIEKNYGKFMKEDRRRMFNQVEL
jgi:integrase